MYQILRSFMGKVIPVRCGSIIVRCLLNDKNVDVKNSILKERWKL